VATFKDPDHYVHTMAIDGARIGGGAHGTFNASIGRLDLDGVRIIVSSINAPMTLISKSPDDHLFSFGGNQGAVRRISGQDVPDNHLMHSRPNDVLSTNNLSGHTRTYAGIVIPRDVMAIAGPSLMGMDPRVPLNDNALFATSPGLLPDLVRRLDKIIQIAADTPAITHDPVVLRALSGTLVADLMRCLATSRPTPEPVRLHRRRHIIAKLIELMEEQPEEMLSMTDVCQALNVPERTLNFLCQEFFGVSAMRYVRGRRMDHVRRCMLNTDPAHASVTAIATRYGFWDLGRFAQAYRNRYGERPSRTIQRIGD
jgi:AraC-like DNA-binding protein